MKKGHFECRYADEETWQVIDEKRMIWRLESYYKQVNEVIDCMKDGQVIRTPFAFYRWIEEAKKHNPTA